MAELLRSRRNEGMAERNRCMASQTDANVNLEAMEETENTVSETGTSWDTEVLCVSGG